MTTRHEIAPGYGNKGITTARELLVERCRAAAVEAVGHEDKIRVSHDGDHGYPFLVATFDSHTKLIVRFWQHDALWGFDPWIFAETVRSFDWTVKASSQDRPVNWQSEIETIVEAVQRVLTTVQMVEIP